MFYELPWSKFRNGIQSKQIREIPIHFEPFGIISKNVLYLFWRKRIKSQADLIQFSISIQMNQNQFFNPYHSNHWIIWIEMENWIKSDLFFTHFSSKINPIWSNSPFQSKWFSILNDTDWKTGSDSLKLK